MVWKLTITEKLTDLAKAALELRKAGVTRVAFEGLELELLEWSPPPPAPQQLSIDGNRGVAELDIFEDPDTYGIVGRVPGFPRAKREEE